MTEDHGRFRAAGAEVVALVSDTGAHAHAYFHQHGIPFPCLVDPEHTVYDRYEVESKLLSLGQRPALFVIDREGVVRYAYLGWQQWEIPPNGRVIDVCHHLPCTAGV